MASESSKGFDFASDDILCSYEDYDNRENSNASHSDSANQEFQKSRMARTSGSSYRPTEDSDNKEVIILAVERSMKKHTDNVMRFLEGLSSRMSQLELYCYNLDKSIGEMRSNLTLDHTESDAKLKSLEKHLQEVHRSVQILRDKQELADTQKELAKLQLAQKESSSPGHNSQQNNDDRSSTPDTQKHEAPVDPHGQQLALVPAAQPPQRAPEPMAQPQAYYLPPGSTQGNQSQYPPQVQSLPQYQQQWTVQVHPQPSIQQGSRTSSSPRAYPQYFTAKPPANLSPPEPLPKSMPMQMTYSAIPPPVSNQPIAYSYSGPVRTAQPQPQPQQLQTARPQPQPQQLQMGFTGQPGDRYAASGPPPPPNTYMVYDNAPGRVQVQHPSPEGKFYPPPNQRPSGGGVGGMMPRPPQQFMRNHPYNEVIDKLVSMGYPGDHVMSVIQRLDESGQTVDFNAVLDRLNGGGWSG